MTLLLLVFAYCILQRALASNVIGHRLLPARPPHAVKGHDGTLPFVQIGTDQTMAGGFVSSCAYPGAKFTNPYLGVYCINSNPVFSYNYTVIDLGYCVGNNNGHLTAYARGNFSNSCDNCTTAHKNSLVLTCDCHAADGSVHQSSTDLNRILSNNNGSLNCFGYAGNKTWIPTDG